MSPGKSFIRCHIQYFAGAAKVLHLNTQTGNQKIFWLIFGACSWEIDEISFEISWSFDCETVSCTLCCKCFFSFHRQWRSAWVISTTKKHPWHYKAAQSDGRFLQQFATCSLPNRFYGSIGLRKRSKCKMRLPWELYLPSSLELCMQGTVWCLSFLSWRSNCSPPGGCPDQSPQQKQKEMVFCYTVQCFRNATYENFCVKRKGGK